MRRASFNALVRRRPQMNLFSSIPARCDAELLLGGQAIPSVRHIKLTTHRLQESIESSVAPALASGSA